MSWGLRLAGDARADLKELDVWLQEEAIDELERVVVDPPSLLRRKGPGRVVHDIELEHDGERHLVFLTLYLEDDRRVLRVLGIYHHLRRD